MQRIFQGTCLVFLGLGIFLWNDHFAFVQFGGNDGGILINVAWAQYTGLVPYRDFATPLPALFVYPAGWAFMLGGPTWKSLTLLICGFSVLTFVWSFSLFSKATGRVWTAMAFAFVLQAVSSLTLSWWWYNQVTALIEAIYVSSVFFLVLKPTDEFARASFGLSVALTALAKANTAGVLLILTHVVLLIIPATRRFVLVATSCAALADLIFLWFCHVSAIVLLQNYLLLSRRVGSLAAWKSCLCEAFPGEQIPSIILDLVLAACVLYLVWANRAALTRTGHYRAVLGLVGASVATLVVGSLTNSDLKMGEAAVLIAALPFIFFLIDRPGHFLERFSLSMVCAIMVYFVLGGLMIGATRASVFSTGPLFFAELAPLHEIKQPRLFEGMAAGPRLHDVLDDVAQVLKDNNIIGHPDKKIFFGPRIDFCYAAFHIPFQAGLPICWENIPSTHHGEDLPMGIPMTNSTAPARWIAPGEPLDPRVTAFINARFDLCIFLDGWMNLPDMSYFPADIRAELYEHYSVKQEDRVFVFTRIPMGSASGVSSHL
jgi:hypothetical protein